MEKSFKTGITKLDGKEVEYLRIKSDEPIEESEGFSQHTEEYSDCIVTERYRITRLLKYEQNPDAYYAWFIIDNHTKNIDTSVTAKKIAEKNKAVLDYNIMMENIEDPEESESEE